MPSDEYTLAAGATATNFPPPYAIALGTWPPYVTTREVHVMPSGDVLLKAAEPIATNKPPPYAIAVYCPPALMLRVVHVIPSGEVWQRAE
jgi:hypothetical protein